jgi:hypothetical protein
MAKKKKLRPLGDITTDMEPLLYKIAETGNVDFTRLDGLLEECFKGHKLQLHELFGIINCWNNSHGMAFNVIKLQEFFSLLYAWSVDCYPDCLEIYEKDGSHPVLNIAKGYYINYGSDKE